MDTREQILESAWKLFGKHGFENVSVRDVTNDADVNLASVSYYFGCKKGLIQEVVKQVLNPANQHRLQLLEQVIREAGSIEKVTLEQVIQSYLRPVMFPEEHGGSMDMLRRLSARYMIENDYDVPHSVSSSFEELFQSYVAVLAMKLPGLKPEAILRGLLFSVGSAMHYDSFSGLADKVQNKEPDSNREKDFQALVEFVIGGLKV